MKKKKSALIILISILLWGLVFAIDYSRVHSFERPIFCVLTNDYDDGGSGIYKGLGYSFKIVGNFMPEDEFPGVTSYAAKLFGVTIKRGIRD